MSDAHLRASIIDAALDVAREANRPSSTAYEIQFATGTLHRLGHELRQRSVGATLVSVTPPTLLDTNIPGRAPA